TNPAALAYFFPGLARLALLPPSQDHGWYASQLLFHLDRDEPENAFYLYCSAEQRAAVARLLEHIVETRAFEVNEDDVAARFHACRSRWAGAAPTRSCALM